MTGGNEVSPNADALFCIKAKRVKLLLEAQYKLRHFSQIHIIIYIFESRKRDV